FPPERPQNPPPKPPSNSSPWIWDPQRKVYYQQQPYQAQYPMSQYSGYDQPPYYAGSASQQQVSNPERGYQGVSQNQSQGPSTSTPYAYSYPGWSGVGKKETKK
ncbi:MAG: hypothetical protein M1830_008127, partial [Pleopsidium flavum]